MDRASRKKIIECGSAEMYLAAAVFQVPRLPLLALLVSARHPY